MRKWIKRIIVIFFVIPILLFGVLVMALYIPSLQNYLKREVTTIASDAIGMDIELGRIDLRYPFNLLLSDLVVKEKADSLFSMKSLNLQVKILPLLRGRIDLNELTLRNISINTQQKIEGVSILGELDYLFVKSHGVDLKNEKAVVNVLHIKDTDLKVCMVDTVSSVPDSTASNPIFWKAILKKCQLENVNVEFSMPTDSMHIIASVGDFQLDDVSVDLGRQIYALNRLDLVETSLRYQQGSINQTDTLDFSNLFFNEIHIGLDSIYSQGKEFYGVIRDISMREQSGLHIASTQGRFQSDSISISVPNLLIKTDYSNLNLRFSSLWEFLDNPKEGVFEAELRASLAPEDLFIIVPSFPEKFQKDFPQSSLNLNFSLGGNLSSMQINPLRISWPGAVAVNGKGKLLNLLDENRRTGDIDLKTQIEDLNFITSLFDEANDSIPSLFIPHDISLLTEWRMRGVEHAVNLALQEGNGDIKLKGQLNQQTENYEALLSVDSLQLQHFLPQDSLGLFSATVELKGKGLDLQSKKAVGGLNLVVDQLVFGSHQLAKINVDATWNEALLKLQLRGSNDLLSLNADGQYNLASTIPIAELNFTIDEVNLMKLGLIDKEMEKPFVLSGGVKLTENLIEVLIESGDFSFDFNTPYSVLGLTKQLSLFTDELSDQLADNYRINPDRLRAFYPLANLKIKSKTNNSIADFLQTKKIYYKDINFEFSLDTLTGIQGVGGIEQIAINANKIDSFILSVNQIEDRIKFKTGLINKKTKPGFQSYLLGEIGEKKNEAKLYYENASGERGLDFGIHIAPLDSGFNFHLIPENPVIAFKNFNYTNNTAYIHPNWKLSSMIDLYDKEGIGFQLHSVVVDSTQQQSLNFEVQHIELAEIARVVPFLPQISGLFSIEAHTFEVDNSTLISAEVAIDELNYENKRVGDLAWGLTWMPDEVGNHYLDSYLHHDEEEVLIADGRLNLVGSNETLDFRTQFQHFPMLMLNAFVPDGLLTFQGDIDGELFVTGNINEPKVNGNVILDSVSVFSDQWGVQLHFDNRPLAVTNNQLKFDKFSIYTTEKNPFTIDGNLDFVDVSSPKLDVHLKANDYVLLDAKRTKESLAYGKVIVDVNTTVKGPLDALVLRGGMSLNGKTDVSYVLKDSPLTVQDRLGDLVTFTSFSDTLHVEQEDSVFRTLGGMDLLLSVNIDPAVRLKVDLSEDRSSRISLEGGGNLTLQYTPQGDLALSGRYTLTGGLIRYSLPVIPLKDFNITEGSYVEWTGDVTNPKLDIKATERLRAAVADENNQSRRVNFDLSVLIKNRVNNLDLKFDIEAPEDSEVQKQLLAMSEDERIKQAVVMMATGRFMASDGGSTGSGLDMGTALNSVLQSQINAIAGKMDNVSFSVGVDEYDETSTGGRHTDYSFSYSQRFFNNRVQIVIGGKVSTGENVTNDMESFIDNISVEYRLDNTGTRYVRLFHNKNYDNILEGEVIETGVGLILRRKVDRLSELFIFKRKKKESHEDKL